MGFFLSQKSWARIIPVAHVSRKATPFMCSLVGLRGGRRARRTYNFIMGNDKRKRTKQTPDTDNSDFDENSQPPTTSTNDTSPQHFPRFILFESKEEGRQITSLSPFLIQKV